MAWFDTAVFYHIYPLGLCGCPRENTGEEGNGFDKLKEWAEHAAALHCTALYIGPLFESAGHGYETTDYRKVDVRLGENKDFTEFVRYCHTIGLRVIVDAVFNHTGRDFFAMRDLRAHREASAYRDWYCNVNFCGNNEYGDGFSYDNWGGYNLLAKLNLKNPQVKEYLFETVRFWIEEFDIDGLRLDAADVLDFDFMRELRSKTEERKKDFFLLGEVIHGDYSRWANDAMLHSVTNYELHKALYSGHNDHNYFEIAHNVKRLLGICGMTRLYTFTDNHDVERIYTKLAKKENWYPVALLQYTLYGIPSVYYGSEFCVEGRKESGSDWSLRPCLSLREAEKTALGEKGERLFGQLGALKKQYLTLSYGEYKELYLTNRQYAFARMGAEEVLVTAVNNDEARAEFAIPLPCAATEAVSLLTGVLEEEAEARVEAGKLFVSLPANAGAVFLLKA